MKILHLSKLITNCYALITNKCRYLIKIKTIKLTKKKTKYCKAQSVIDSNFAPLSHSKCDPFYVARLHSCRSNRENTIPNQRGGATRNGAAFSGTRRAVTRRAILFRRCSYDHLALY